MSSPLHLLNIQSRTLKIINCKYVTSFKVALDHEWQSNLGYMTLRVTLRIDINSMLITYWFCTGLYAYFSNKSNLT